MPSHAENNGERSGPVQNALAPSRGSRNAQKKREVRELLVRRELSGLRQWAARERSPLRALSSLLFEDDLLIRWRAIEALGQVAQLESRRDVERVRRLLRRILWLMNDESGGVCWNGPEAVGEVVHNVPSLLGEFGKLMPSFFQEAPFERGSRWAVARMAPLEPAALAHAIPALVPSLDDPDPGIRGLSLLALKALGGHIAKERRDVLIGDRGAFSMYDFQTGTLAHTTVGEVCRDAF